MNRLVVMVALVAGFVVATSAAAAPSPAAPAPAGPLALDDAAKRAQELDVLAKFVPHAETFWRASDLTEPNTGWYSAVGSGVSQPRGAGDIAFVEATLLYADPDQATFGGVSRQTMLDHTIQSIRHEALTNVLSGASYKRWGGDTWQASLETLATFTLSELNVTVRPVSTVPSALLVVAESVAV